MADSRVAALAEGALMAALTVVLVLAGYFIPFLQIITNIIWTVPIVVLIVRRDMRIGAMATVTSALAIAFFTGPLNAFLLFIQFAGLGLVYGYLFKTGAGPGLALIAGGLVSTFSTILSLFVTSVVTGLPLGGILQEFEAAVAYTLDFYRHMGMLEHMARSGINPEELQAALAGMIGFLKLLLPGILVTAAMGVALANYLVASKVLHRLGLVKEGPPPFRYWQLPWYAVWGVIAGLALWQAGDYYGLTLIYKAGLNILYIYIPLLVGNGLAALSFLLHRLRPGPFIKMLILFGALINLPVVLFSLAVFGLFEPFFSNRRMHPSDKGE